MVWHVYIIQCTNDALYTGVTTHVGRRLSQHLNKRGAKFFRANRPKYLVYLERGHTRSSACRREAAIKKMSRSEKLRLLESENNAIQEGGIDIFDYLTRASHNYSE